MAQLKCRTCGGVYDDVLPDGTRYFHACPPVVDEKTGTATRRPEARDENVVRPAVKNTPPVLKREGKGVELLAGEIGTPTVDPDA